MSFIKSEGWGRDLLQGLGEGPAVTFSHGWPLSSDMWDGQMLFLAVARLPHGRPRPASPGPIPARRRRATTWTATPTISPP